jgi:hypothetical protein
MVHYVQVVVAIIKRCYGILMMENIYIHLIAVLPLMLYAFHQIVIGFVQVQKIDNFVRFLEKMNMVLFSSKWKFD